MKFIYQAMAAVSLGFCMSASATVPAAGMWIVDSELTGKPGRGFQIEVENETLIFTYYGYRANGTSIFYIATGKMIGNTFAAPLLDIKNGRVIGGGAKDGEVAGEVGTVNMNFTSGVHGTITLPGEAPVAFTKYAFGYGDQPAGLLGTFHFLYESSASISGEKQTLTQAVGTSTSDGNGIVANAAGNFACENITKAGHIFRGMVFCADIVTPNTSLDDAYVFRMAGDRGTGFGKWRSASSFYAVHVTRVANKSGRKTGINDGTESSAIMFSAPASTDTSLDTINLSAPSSGIQDTFKLSVGDVRGQQLSTEQVAAYNNWKAEVSRLLLTK